MNCKTRSALETVLSISALPHVTVTPTRSIAGERCAMTIAIASSWPGSQSKRIGVGRTAGDCAVVILLASRGRGRITGDGLLEDPHEAAPVDARADLSRLRSVGGQKLTAAIGDRLPARDPTVEDDVDEKRFRHRAEGGIEGQGDGNDVVHRKADQVEKLAPDIDVDRESILDHRQNRMISCPGKVREIVARQHACGGAVVLAYVKRNEDRLDAGVQNDAGGFGIRPDVIFRDRSHVARGNEISAKEHQTLKSLA